MNKRNVISVALTLLFMLSIGGCGSTDNNNTNGQITLAAEAPVSGAGTATLNATAAVIPGSGTTIVVPPGLPGADVDFTYSQYGLNSAGAVEILVNSTTESAPTNSLGVATFSHVFLQSLDMATTIQVTAKFDDLTSKTINIPVPKYVPQ